MAEHIHCLIIGSGPAGYTAAIYAARANLKPVLLEGQQCGGQLTQTTMVDNFPGYKDGVDGNEMMSDLRAQALRFGAQMRPATVTRAWLDETPFRFQTDEGGELTADGVIIATGAKAKYLGLPDETKYSGQGVSACATCDGFFYRKRTVAVVGGGDTACEDALYLASLAKKVYIIVRKNYLRASKIMQQRVREAENIEVLFETNATGLFGENGVQGAHLVHRKGEADETESDIAIDGFFLAIGHKPQSDLFSGQLEMDKEGYILTFHGTQATSVSGVFAAGDVADPRYRQAITAAASGCKAALDLEKYLMAK